MDVRFVSFQSLSDSHCEKGILANVRCLRIGLLTSTLPHLASLSSADFLWNGTTCCHVIGNIDSAQGVLSGGFPYNGRELPRNTLVSALQNGTIDPFDPLDWLDFWFFSAVMWPLHFFLSSSKIRHVTRYSFLHLVKNENSTDSVIFWPLFEWLFDWCSHGITIIRSI